jgi:hypothetical protein
VKNEDLMTNLDSIVLTVCQVEKVYLPVWLSNLPDSRSDNIITVVTWLNPQIVSQIGLPKDSICGFLAESNEAVVPEHFTEYANFVEAIHEICKEDVDQQLIEFASRTAEQSVALIDQRSLDINAEIPAEDIIGTYQIKNGLVQKYVPNPSYRLVTSRGCFQLTPWLRKCMWSRVMPGDATST